jgi:hypothetical protein
MKTTALVLVFILLGLCVLANTPAACAESLPTLSLKDSIPIAEAALSQALVSISDYYIFSITYTNSSKGSFWYFQYRPLSSSGSGQIFVKVYMDKTTEILGGSVSKKAYQRY